MNFGMIFVCLLTGAVIGYEVGCYTMKKKLSAMIDTMVENMKKATEVLRKQQEHKDIQKAEEMVEL